MNTELNKCLEEAGLHLDSASNILGITEDKLRVHHNGEVLKALDFRKAQPAQEIYLHELSIGTPLFIQLTRYGRALVQDILFYTQLVRRLIDSEDHLDAFRENLRTATSDVQKACQMLNRAQELDPYIDSSENMS